MRLLDRYIISKVAVGTLFGVCCLSSVLLLGQLFKEIKPLIESQQAPLMQVAKFLWSSVPFMLTFTLPWAFLTSVILTVGKLSSNNELIGMRMAGWSLWRVAAPVIMMGLVLSGFSFWLNGTVAPRAKDDIQELLLEAVKKDPQAYLSPGRVQKQLSSSAKLYVEDKEGEDLYGFHFCQFEAGSPYPTSYVHAQKVAVTVVNNQEALSLDLREAYIETKDDSSPIIIADQAQPWIINIASKKKRKKLGSMTNREIDEELRANKDKLDKKATLKRVKEVAKRQSMSLACLSLGMLAVPLALQSRRKDNNMGFLVAIGVAAVYFGLLMGLEGVGASVWLRRTVIFMPNILSLGIALWLYRRAAFTA